MREIVDMEHMAIPWIANYNDESQQWDIVTDNAGEPWYVACVPLALPGDYDGEKTAKAICELHNRSLTSNPTGLRSPRFGGDKQDPVVLPPDFENHSGRK